MAFLTIGGVNYDVLTDDAAQLEPETIGATSRAFLGGLRSSIRAEKRVWENGLQPLTPAQIATLRANTALGAFVACSGTLLGGAVTCRVQIIAEKRAPDTDVTTYLGLVRVRLTEV